MNADSITRETFTFYSSWETAISSLPSVEARESVYRAVARYSLFGEEPTVTDPMAMMCWNLIKPIIDKARVRSYAGSSSGECKARYGNNNACIENAKTQQKRNKNATKTQVGIGKGIGIGIGIERDSILGKSSLSDKQFSCLDNLVSETTHFKNLSYPMTREQWNKLYSGWNFGTTKFSLIIKDIITECDRYLCNPEGTKKVGAYEMIIDKLEHKGFRKNTI